ncbi:MAG: ABC transporter permease [Synergistaceae bacterium]|nr:ABC transporter permease [Synergistaceae bacterium]
MSKNVTGAEIGAIQQFGDIDRGMERKFTAAAVVWTRTGVDFLRLAGRRAVEFLKGIFGIVAFLVLWEACSRLGVIDSVFIPPFSKICTSLWSLAASGELGYHSRISLFRAVAGLGIGISAAVPLGLLVGEIPIVERFLGPILQTFRQTSTLALVPVFILLLGLGETSKVSMIVWGVSWPILLSTISGVKSVDPLFIKAAKSMNESRFGILTKIILPAALPHIFTGIRLGATSSIMLLIIAEMWGASAGLGFLIYDFQIKYQIPEMFSIIALFSILGLVWNYVLVAAEKKVIKWKPEAA